ncbi:MAG: hypothetical protein JST06_04290 [Bacteroidetes bacterium]|nr:hypothetical protein [Bacteroidota bacterium]MBS1628953.1 hypothetical protein [Bacteroidota bacterium]
MKNVFFLGVTILVLTVSDQLSATCYNTRKDAQRNGYDKVSQSDYNTVGGTTSYLFCKEPGTKACKYSDGHIPPMVGGIPLDDYVNQQILSGELVGNVVLDDGNGNELHWEVSSDGSINYSYCMQ